MTAKRCYLAGLGIANALGAGAGAVRDGLLAGDSSGMRLEEGWLPSGAARLGSVRAALPELPPGNERFDCRNNRLMLFVMEQIRAELERALERFGPGRIGVVLGTSTSGIDEAERAIAALVRDGALPARFHLEQQEIGTPAPLLARLLGLGGPAYTVSTACTSSAKALASAGRLVRAGLCDAVIAGGVDTLCKLTVNGFAALEATTAELTNPLSRNRRGINLGEGAALTLVTREPQPLELLGWGESSDAHHISAPDPGGRGAELAMRAALERAGLAPRDVDYVNLHATATPKNDEMESAALVRVFPDGVACSGTKPLTGHTLGAAGATEAAFCLLALGDGRLPPHVWDGEADPALPRLRVTRVGERFARSSGRVCLSNSFAFGGNNACLVLGDAR